MTSNTRTPIMYVRFNTISFFYAIYFFQKLATMSSLSRHFREEGNGFYKSSCKNGLPNCLRKSYLSDALLYYRKALNSAQGVEDKTSASKNLGMASWKFAG